MPHHDQSFWRKAMFWLATFVIGVTALGAIFAAGLIAILSIGLPDVRNLDNLDADQSTEIFDREGNLLYTIHGDENREFVPLEEMSQLVQDATIAVEDKDFWEHGGFDLKALGSALLSQLFGVGTPRGGSTITQQYVKNTFLSPERSYIRKAKELILSIRLERTYDKEQILELYLNRIPYGNNAFGVQKAAEVYFGKPAKDLDLAESVVLASLPQAPSRYNPYGNNKYSHLLKEFTGEELYYRKIKSESDLEVTEYVRGLIGEHVDLGDGTKIYIPGRTDIVLKTMYDQKEITKEERQKALDELQTITFNTYREAIEHPHFVLYIKQILEDKYTKDIVERGGLKVYTTLDPALQNYAEEVVSKNGETLKNVGASNMALMAINPQTGQILAMIGSYDYFNEEIDGNVNVVLRPRQMGSSFKPLVYAQAFLNGYGPGSVTYDIPTRIGNDRPVDFDGQWKGQMTLREALGQSRNIPAIQAYFLAGEQDPVIDLAHKMGVLSLDKAHSYGYPLALGAGEVSLYEMMSAYGTFANAGKRPDLTAILKVENSNGDVIEEWRQKEFEEVLDPQVAFLINNILSDRSVGLGARMYVSGKTNAAKTGTSTKENKKEAGGAVLPSDLLTYGYTPSAVVGVWAGNADGTGLASFAEAYNVTAPVMSSVLGKALEKLPDESFPEPEGIKRVQISKASGKLPGSDTPSEMIKTEVFASWAVPTEVEQLFFKVKIDKISGLLATEYTPDDAIEEVTFQNYVPIANKLNWMNEIRDYYEKYKINEQAGDVRVGLPPTEFDNVHTPENAAKKPTLTINNPATGTILGFGNFKVEVDLSADNGVAEVQFFIDDKKEFSTKTSPYTGYLNISKFMEAGSKHLVVAKVIDALGYSAQAAIEVKVENSSQSTEN